jgi:hypothetical protein
VFLNLVEPVLCPRLVSLLPEPLYFEVCYFVEVVFRRVPYFVVKERYIIVYVIVDL